MISNFDGASGGEEPEDVGPDNPLFKAFGAAKGGPMHSVSPEQLAKQLEGPEHAFIQHKPNPKGLDILRGSPKDISSWFFKRQEKGEIPSDWPEPQCYEEEGKGHTLLKAYDWATFVLFTSLLHSDGEDLFANLPDSYEEVAHHIWKTTGGVVLIWDGQLRMAQIVTGKVKDSALKRLDRLNAGQLDLSAAQGALPHAAATVVALHLASQELFESADEEKKNAFSREVVEHFGDEEAYTDAVAVSFLIYARLLVRQTPGFHLHRCVAMAETNEGDTIDICKIVLCSESECGKGSSLHKSCLKEELEEEGGGDLNVLLVLDDQDEAFGAYDDDAAWAVLDVPDWVLTPRAKEKLAQVAISP